MAVLFRDSFDTYNTSQITAKWAVNNNAVVGAGAARNGAQGLVWSSPNNNFFVQWNLPAANTNTLYLGFAIFPRGLSPGTENLAVFLKGTSVQCAVWVDATSHLILSRNGTVLATSTSTVSLNAWHYIEIKLLVNSATGVMEVRVDGVVFATFTGNTQNVAGGVDNFQLFQGWIQGAGPIGGPFIDDLYLLDSSGANAWLTTYLGDIKVISGLPNANGSTNQWTPNGAASNFQCVDEAPWDGNTSYVSDATPGQIDLYAYPSISAAAVYDVCVNLVADKDDTALRSVRSEVKSGATQADNGSDFVLTQSSYQNFQGDFPVDPNTSAQWGVAAVNAAQFGPRETA